MFRKKLRELPVPPEVHSASQSAEVVRFWVADGTDHVSLMLDMIQSSQGHHAAETWGAILADIGHHVVNGLKQTGSSESKEVLLALIERGFAERTQEKAEISGQVIGDKNAH